MADFPAQAVLNEAAIKRVDPYVKEILDTAQYVALYSYDQSIKKWEKTKIEGSLFVYSRTGEPYHNILILNRLNTTNLIEPISENCDLNVEEPFLLYRDNKLRIYGIWFYAADECTRFAKLIAGLMERSEKKSPPKNRASWGPSMDIFNMLTKAQEAYNSKSSNNVKQERSPQDVDPTVMEFFAKAGNAPQKPGVTASKVLARSKSVTTQEAGDKLNPLIHQLMSNPVHSVEHIEKQQRSVTPQTEAPQVCKNYLRPLNHSEDAEDKGSGKVENGVNGFNFLRITSPSQGGVFPLAEACATQPSSSVETPSKPALMPPAMFTPSATHETSLCDSAFTFSDAPEPLTRNQLLQALNYLLKNDAEFVHKIHEAYVKSLTNKVS